VSCKSFRDADDCNGAGRSKENGLSTGKPRWQGRQPIYITVRKRVKAYYTIDRGLLYEVGPRTIIVGRRIRGVHGLCRYPSEQNKGKYLRAQEDRTGCNLSLVVGRLRLRCTLQLLGDRYSKVHSLRPRLSAAYHLRGHQKRFSNQTIVNKVFTAVEVVHEQQEEVRCIDTKGVVRSSALGRKLRPSTEGVSPLERDESATSS